MVGRKEQWWQAGTKLTGFHYVIRWEDVGHLSAWSIDGDESYSYPCKSLEQAKLHLIEAHSNMRLGKFVKPELHPYEYYPLIDRLGPEPTLQKDEHAKERSASQVSLSSILEMLRSLFLAVEPDESNSQVFGQTMRQILILACTEVEAAWKSTLKANGYKCDNASTKDYVKLCRPMSLDERSVRLTAFPNWPEIVPFSGWKSSHPTQSLPWYDAYNKVKHDKEAHLNQAKLCHVIDAVAGMVVMHAAQFGRDNQLFTSESYIVRFDICKWPIWPPGKCYYGFGNSNQDWRSRSLFAAK